MIPESSKVRRNRRLIFGVTAGAVFLLGLWSLCEWCFQMPAQSGPPSTGGMRPHAEASPEAVAQRSQAGDTRTAGVRRNLKGEAATGTVEVVAEYSDGSVANGVGITLRRFGMDLNVEILRTITDNAGRCGVFDAPVGDYVVGTSVGPLDHDENERIVVKESQTTKLHLVIPAEYAFDGKVVDALGTPIKDADVWVAEPLRVGTRAEIGTRTNAFGEFQLRTMLVAAIVWARARNYAPSEAKFISGEQQELKSIVLVLPGVGGNLTGRVLDDEGKPVRGAVVRAGSGRLDRVLAVEGGKPLPSEAISDESGEFLVAGLPIGSQPVIVRADRFAPWESQCSIAPGNDTRLEVVLQLGGTVKGKVVGSDGSIVTGALVECGDPGSLKHYQCLVDGLAQYELHGLAAGETRITARTRKRGRGEATVFVTANADVAADIVISKGLTLEGVLKADKGAGVADARIEAMETEKQGDTSWFQYVQTNAAGEFLLTNVPVSKLTICAKHQSIYNVALRGVDGTSGFITLNTTLRPAASAMITGRLVVEGVGSRVAAKIRLKCEDVGSDTIESLSEGDDGKFLLGPVAPGSYILRVSCGMYPMITRHARIDADARWDLGDIVIGRGGSISVSPIESWPEDCYFGIWDSSYQWVTSIRGQATGGCSELLEPGEYYVSTLGEGIGRIMKKVAVVAGETTPVAMEARIGSTVKFEVPDMRPGDAFTLRVSNGDGVVWQRPCFCDAIGFAYSVALLPGDYTVECFRANGSHRVHLEVRNQTTPQVCKVMYMAIGGR